MILSLDISTSITGVCIFNQDGKMLLSEAIDLRNDRKFHNIYEKIREVQIRLMKYKQAYPIEAVYIEKSLNMFTSGKSSANILFLLAGFNMVVSWLCYSVFGVEPEHLSATSARKSAGLRVPRGSDTKKAVIEYVLNNEPPFVVEYTPKGNPKPECFDRADAWIIGKAGYIAWKTEQKK